EGAFGARGDAQPILRARHLPPAKSRRNPCRFPGEMFLSACGETAAGRLGSVGRLVFRDSSMPPSKPVGSGWAGRARMGAGMQNDRTSTPGSFPEAAFDVVALAA